LWLEIDYQAILPLDNLILTYNTKMRMLKKGAGNFLPRVWGCPPALQFPQDWGRQGVEYEFFCTLINNKFIFLNKFVI